MAVGNDPEGAERVGLVPFRQSRLERNQPRLTRWDLVLKTALTNTPGTTGHTIGIRAFQVRPLVGLLPIVSRDPTMESDEAPRDLAARAISLRVSLRQTPHVQGEA